MNRDESYERNTARLQYWPEIDVYCGKDLEKNGTWLAINRNGWFVAITNIKKEKKNDETESVVSRGTIPLKLLNQKFFDPFLWKDLLKSSGCKNFNALFGNLNVENGIELFAYSSDTEKLYKIDNNGNNDGVINYLTNGPIESNWPKGRKGKLLIQNLIDGNNFTKDSLFEVLKDDEIFSMDQKVLNDDFTNWPIFINSNESRGTVSSSIILVKYSGEVEFIEKTWSNNQEISQVLFTLNK